MRAPRVDSRCRLRWYTHLAGGMEFSAWRQRQQSGLTAERRSAFPLRRPNCASWARHDTDFFSLQNSRPPTRETSARRPPAACDCKTIAAHPRAPTCECPGLFLSASCPPRRRDGLFAGSWKTWRTTLAFGSTSPSRVILRREGRDSIGIARRPLTVNLSPLGCSIRPRSRHGSRRADTRRTRLLPGCTPVSASKVMTLTTVLSRPA